MKPEQTESNPKMAIDSLHENNDLDELIADTSSLIESVYNILEQPQRTPPAPVTPLLGRRTRNNSNSGQYGSNSTSPKSPKTPRLGLPNRTLLSTPSSQEIDREINRIDRFCAMLEHNLRSVSAQQTERRLRSLSPSAPIAEPRSPRNTPRRDSDTQANQRRSPTPEAVIDLCDSMYIPTTTQMRCPYTFDTSDDVIIVTPSDDDIVDLCTPTYRRNNARSRITSRRTINSDLVRSNDANSIRQCLIPSRRSQPPSSDARSSCSSVSTTTSTTNIAAATTPRVQTTNNQNNKQTNDAPGARFENMNLNGATDGNGGGRVPFMCAVCMESCVNNQPTSTKCGHVYCANCIRQAVRLTRKCPMCNTKVTANQLFRIYV